MAYRFDGVDDKVEFALNPFSGYTFGAFTMACLLKRGAVAANHAIVDFTNSTPSTIRLRWRFVSGNQMNASTVGGGSGSGSATYASTSLWYLLALTTANPAADLRFHSHNETAWTHQSVGFGLSSETLVAGDRLHAGFNGISSEFLNGDMVCLGIKKANSTDGQIEALSRTAWSAWQAFGFDWLIGFDTSQETAGVLQDQATPGTGDEIAITGTTLVSDPPGWSWGAPASTFVPRIMVVT